MLTISACSSVSYYGQSILGHSRLMLAREPIDKVIETAQPELRKQLVLAKKIRQFAVDELGLPANDSYLSYVDLPRKYPVWNVVAAEEFSVEPRSWCYPVIGCASYRGYFSLQAAESYAQRLTDKGLDVAVGGVTAYSTLGWFADPLLPSMLREGESGLAETIFHELAHQVFYRNGESDLNEAFASVVGEKGTFLWLRQNRPDSASMYSQRLKMRGEFYALLKQSKNRLRSLYQSALSNEDKRIAKQVIFNELKHAYTGLKNQQWDGRSDYDGWFAQSLNNAHLAAVSTYREQMGVLEGLLRICNDDFVRFYETLNSTTFKADAGEMTLACNSLK